MRGKKICTQCGKSFSSNETALSLKFLGRNITDFYCINCLAEFLECDCEDLEVKIEEFKEQGCTLFL